MKHIKNYIPISLLLILLNGTYSCTETWDAYYSSKAIETDSIEVFTGTVKEYLSSKNELSSIYSIFHETRILNSVKNGNDYTVIVCTNDVLGNTAIADKMSFAKNSISDIAFSPSKLANGAGITTRLGKNIWISQTQNGGIYFDNNKLLKKVKTANGFIYYVSGIIEVRNSIYDYFNGLGSDYSYFKSIVKRYEESFFDKEKSTPISIDGMGNTVYDTVMTKRNKLIDRYTEDGLKKWDMFSEDYLTTMFIPSNDLINSAINSAMNNVPIWLNRAATNADKLKFEDWIVRACFVNRRLENNEVSATSNNDINCIDGFQQKIDLTQDVKKYESMAPAIWRPSVQRVNTANPIKLSNGVAYFVTQLKIPNHVVIYRAKAKFYELWGAMTETQQKKYFRWTNWVEPLIVNDAQSSFTLTETLPTMYYHVLTAIPSAQAITDSAKCSVTYDGVLYNSTTRKLAEVNLPAGEYYLRMGFKHSLRYSIDIYFNNQLLVEDMLLFAQGSNFHFDRGSVSDMDYYGSSTIGYPEGFNWRDWIEKDEKAVAYDTDGFQVAIVNLPSDGNFTITIASKDNAQLYSTVNGRSKNNVTQLMMYHWCLRPTNRNY